MGELWASLQWANSAEAAARTRVSQMGEDLDDSRFILGRRRRKGTGLQGMAYNLFPFINVTQCSSQRVYKTSALM